MFDNKNRKEDLSSDELELMKMIKEYERDEAEEQLQEPEEPHHETLREKQYEPITDNLEDTALINRCDHTKVMSRDQLDDKTLTIMPVGNVQPEESIDHTQNLNASQLNEDVEDDDDPRFELHRNKDKKPKKKKDKKSKKGKKKDEKLNKTVIITIVVASVIALIAGGVLVYNSFFRDKKADDDKITDVTKKKTKKKTTKKTEKEEEKETPKDDHSAEISALQGLIEQERTKYNDYISQVNTKQEQLTAYNTVLNCLNNEVAKAQQAIDNAGGDENVTDAMRTDLANAQESLAKFKNNNPNPPTQGQIDELNRKARECQDNITNYQNQISHYQ